MRILRIAALATAMVFFFTAFSVGEDFTIKDIYEDCTSEEPADNLYCLGFVYGNYVAVTTSPTQVYCANVPAAAVKGAFEAWYVEHYQEEITLTDLWRAWLQSGLCWIKKAEETPAGLDDDIVIDSSEVY